MKFNKLIKFLSLSLAMSFLIVGCEKDSAATDNMLSDNYVGLTEMPKTINIVGGETVAVQGKVFAAKAFNTDRVLDLEVITTSVNNTTAAPTTVPVTTANPAYFTVPTSVTIPAGATEATFPISITGTGLGSGKNIVIGIKAKQGLDLNTSYLGTVGKPNFEVITKRLVIRAKEICNLNPLRIIIATDRYGTETTWELYDSNLVKIAQGGPYTDQAANGVFLKPAVDICLPNGNYTFVAYDAYGDGMNSGAGAGYYRLVKMNADGSAELQEIAKNGTFGANDVVEFSFP